jgi:hypothetical protein
MMTGKHGFEELKSPVSPGSVGTLDHWARMMLAIMELQYQSRECK